MLTYYFYFIYLLFTCGVLVLRNVLYALSVRNVEQLICEGTVHQFHMFVIWLKSNAVFVGETSSLFTKFSLRGKGLKAEAVTATIR